MIFDITYNEIKGLIEPKALSVLEKEYRMLKMSEYSSDLTFKSLAVNRGFFKFSKTFKDEEKIKKHFELKYRIQISAITKRGFEVLTTKKLNSTVVEKLENGLNKELLKQSIVPLNVINKRVGDSSERLDMEFLPICTLYDRVIEGGVDCQEADLFLDALLADSVISGVSDIHFSIEDKISWIKYKIDGNLIEKFCFNDEIHEKFIATIKNLANLDPADRNKISNSNINKMVNGVKITYRVSIIPLERGVESCVIRILDKRKNVRKLKKIFPKNHPYYEQIAKIPKKSSGLFLVVGATGDGKTTTLNALIRSIDRLDNVVSTIEDPIEYNIDYVKQFQVDRSKGRDFNTLLEAQLRHDPSIIVVGELQNKETIGIALRGAEAGHYILSTLHANDSESAIRRLIDEKANPSILANSLLGILSQKLIPALCSCKVEDSDIIDNPLMVEKYSLDTSAKFYKASEKGCNKCNFGGYVGRALVVDSIILHNHSKNYETYKKAIIEGRRLSNVQGVYSFSKIESAKWLLEEGICDLRTIEDRIDDD